MATVRLRIILATLAALPFARANAISIPVVCKGVEVGTIDVHSVPSTAGNPAGVVGAFNATLNPPLTLAGVAAACGEDHFNWFQIIESDPSPPVDEDGNRLQPPYVDPPIGGYGDDPNTPGDDTQWADNLPWLWDEYPPFPNPPPPKGYNPAFQLSARTHPFSLDFLDFPVPHKVGDTLEIITTLVSLNKFGGIDSFHESFTWDVTRTGETEDSITNLRRSIPEPESYSMVALALAILAGFSRTGRTLKSRT